MVGMTQMRRAVLAAGLTLIGTGVAGAQSPKTLMTDPAEIAACLCLNQSVQSSQGDLASAQALYTALKRSVADQAVSLNAARPMVNTNDPAAVEAFRTQVEKHDDDANRLEQDVYPALEAKTTAYNIRVADYDQRCGGRFMDEPVLKRVRANLVCKIAP